MPVYKRTKMCNECPFRAKSMKGWLGPLTVDDLEKCVHGATQFKLPEGSPVPYGYVGDVGDLICHKDIDRLMDCGKSPDEISAQGQQCVGMIRYANSVLKEARRPEVSEYQQRLKKILDQPLIPPFKLREHHLI